MNPKCLVLVLAALVVTVVAPGSLVAAELENPAEGAIGRYYSFYAKGGTDVMPARRGFSELAKRIAAGEEAAYETTLDKGERFDIDDRRRETAMWTGAIRSSGGGEYTLTLASEGGNWPIYSLWINGVQVIDAGMKTTAVNVILRAGFNDFRLVAEVKRRTSVSLSLKRKDSYKEPRNIGPGDIWHEEEPDEDD